MIGSTKENRPAAGARAGAAIEQQGATSLALQPACRQSPSCAQDAALAFLKRGWSVVPVKAGSKQPLISWREYQTRRPTREEVITWYERWPDAGVGIVTGAVSGIVVLDEDGPQGRESLEGRHLPITPVCRTRRGFHRYFKHPGFYVPCKTGILPGVDLKGDGGIVIAPPTPHSDGAYAWVDGLSPDGIPLAPCPEWLLELLVQEESKRDGKGLKEIGEIIPEGARNMTLASAAGALRRRGFSEEEILSALQVMNQRRCRPPLPDQEVERIARSISKYPPATEKPDPATDLANARRFAIRNAHRARYCWGRGWLVWDGTRWAPDETGQVDAFAKETAIAILEEAAAAPDDTLRAKLAKWAVTTQSRPRIRAMLELAQSEPELATTPDDYDQDPWILNTPSGTVDLRTGEVHPHDPKDMLTKITKAPYIPGAKHPVWDAFLDYVTQGNREFHNYLQRAAGYSLAGVCTEEVLFCVLGPTSTGKTTFTEALLAALGDYALKVSFDLLLERSKHHVGAPRPDLVQLRGVRLAAACETARGKRIDAVLLKELTGRDTISARNLYEKPITFVPTHKLWLSSNDPPQIPDRDDAVWRRLRCIPFEHVVTEADPSVKTVLCTDPEAQAAILAWAVEGCLAWQRQGLGNPDLIRRKTAELRLSFDPLATFIRDCCVVSPKAKVRARDLRAAYTEWLEANGGPRCPDREWAPRIESLGARRTTWRVGEGRSLETWWVGIGLRSSKTEAKSPEKQIATQVEPPVTTGTTTCNKPPLYKNEMKDFGTPGGSGGPALPPPDKNMARLEQRKRGGTTNSVANLKGPSGADPLASYATDPTHWPICRGCNRKVPQVNGQGLCADCEAVGVRNDGER